MAVTINGTNGVTTPEVVLDNSAADGAQVVLKSSGYSDWNLDNYSGRLRGYYGSTEYWTVDASGQVGIGNTAPGYRLDVTAGDTTAGFGYAMRLRSNATAAAATLQFTNNAVSAENGYIRVTDAGLMSFSNKAYIDSSGNLLVGTTSTASYGAGIGRLYLSASGANWQVGPTSAFANFYIKAGTGYGVGMTTTATSWSSDSDERKKTALTPFANAAEKVCSLRAGTGRYLTDEENMSRSFLIAQDVQAVLPEAVDVGEDEDQSLMLRYTDLIPLLTAAIQEQQAIITALTARVTALEGA